MDGSYSPYWMTVSVSYQTFASDGVTGVGVVVTVTGLTDTPVQDVTRPSVAGRTALSQTHGQAVTNTHKSLQPCHTVCIVYNIIIYLIYLLLVYIHIYT